MNVLFCMSFLSMSFWITPVTGIHFPGGKSVVKLGGLSRNGFHCLIQAGLMEHSHLGLYR